MVKEKFVIGKYNITVGESILTEYGAELGKSGKVYIVADEAAAFHHLVKLTNRMKNYEVTVVPHSEEAKNMHTVEKLLDDFSRGGIMRNDTIIAFGGGVVGDIAGFAAGIYLRGVKTVMMPTTLLAAVDECIGGKVGVNLESGKNRAGLFVTPAEVICDTDTFSTLPEKEMRCGGAEIIKTAILSGEELFAKTENGENDIISCMKYKAEICTEDEYDNGIRRTLNLGHTVAHAVEKLSDYKTSHGEAVSMGLAVSARLSEKEGYIGKDTAERIIRLLKKRGLPISVPFSAKDMAKSAAYDKKSDGAYIYEPVIYGIGNVGMQKIKTEDYEKMLGSVL